MTEAAATEFLASRHPDVVDLFCGAGGLTLGSYHAGFVTRAAFDVDADLTGSFIENFPSTALHHVDLSEASASDIAALVGPARVAGVIGGPPCQGFSEIGRREDADPRNALVGRFMAIVAELKPKFFLMENVPGLLSDQHSTLIANALNLIPSTYRILERVILNAADYGAATDRHRLVVVGYDPSCVDNLALHDLVGDGALQSTTVRDAIEDLPRPTVLDGFAPLPYVQSASIGTYAAQMRNPPLPGLSNDHARELNRQGRVTGVSATIHTEEVTDRFAMVAQGRRDPVSRYPRLSWDGTAPVLRAGTGRDAQRPGIGRANGGTDGGDFIFRLEGKDIVFHQV